MSRYKDPVDYADAVLTPSAQVSMMESLGLVEHHSKKVDVFRDVIQKYLKPKVDFIEIQGRKHLLRSAIDKIAVLAGVASSFDVTATEHADGSIEYLVKCHLLYGGEIVAQGLGICSSREKKYKGQNVDDIKNTLVKMARIRAKSDAVRQIAALSEIFDDAPEDIDTQEQKIAQIEASKPVDAARLNFINALFVQLGTAEEARPETVKAAFGKERVEDLTRAEADKFIELMQKKIDEMAAEATVENLEAQEDIPF